MGEVLKDRGSPTKDIINSRGRSSRPRGHGPPHGRNIGRGPPLPARCYTGGVDPQGPRGRTLSSSTGVSLSRAYAWISCILSSFPSQWFHRPVGLSFRTNHWEGEERHEILGEASVGFAPRNLADILSFLTHGPSIVNSLPSATPLVGVNLMAVRKERNVRWVSCTAARSRPY